MLTLVASFNVMGGQICLFSNGTVYGVYEEFDHTHGKAAPGPGDTLPEPRQVYLAAIKAAYKKKQPKRNENGINVYDLDAAAHLVDRFPTWIGNVLLDPETHNNPKRLA